MLQPLRKMSILTKKYRKIFQIYKTVFRNRKQRKYFSDPKIESFAKHIKTILIPKKLRRIKKFFRIMSQNKFGSL